ncbi:hypothetical protein [Flavobacterium psychrophilum]|uniref:hypothetical protein n=1 Tax=Flavobacterium psychrophilum TaxID=96345 RepID=UPI00106CD2F5|nr:hypothetical protein [Flavobacterium psychrophilum]
MSFNTFNKDENPLQIFHSIIFENGIDAVFNNSILTDLTNKTKSLETYLKSHSSEIIRLLPTTLNKFTENEKELYISDILHKLEAYNKKLKSANFEINEYSIIIENEIETISNFINSYFSEIVENIRLKNNTKTFFKLGTIESPFFFFEDLIFNGSYTKLVDAFYIETIFTKNYKLALERNEKFIFEAWLNKHDISDMIHYENYLNVVLKYNYEDAFENLNYSLSKLNDEETTIFFKKQLNILNSLIKKLAESDKNQEIKATLLQIISDIDNRFSHIHIAHPVFKNLIPETENIYSLFQLKDGIKRSFFEKLYDASIALDLIDDIEIREEDFIEVFTSPNPISTSKIKFTKPNATVAIFLKELESFFGNFNATTIEKSKFFLNKQGKVLTSTDLFTALSRNKDKENIDLIKIQNEINKLKKQYLK